MYFRHFIFSVGLLLATYVSDLTAKKNERPSNDLKHEGSFCLVLPQASKNIVPGCTELKSTDYTYQKLSEAIATEWVVKNTTDNWLINSVTAIDAEQSSKDICQLILQPNNPSEVKARIRLNFNMLTCDGKSFYKKTWFKVDAEKTIYRADGDIEQYHMISKEDFEQYQVSAFKQSYEGTIESFDNPLRAIVNVSDGQVLMQSMISTLHDVTAGDLVVVLVEMNEMRIERKGIAMNSANIGESIELELMDSKETLTAKVKNKGLAIYE